MTYDEGRVIAYSESELTLIHVRTNGDDSWYEYEGPCYRRD